MDNVPAGSRISLCMIVRDEIDCLGRCIESVRDIVSEIVIVDTGSTDGTLDLAKRYASKLRQIAWNDDFSHARNISLDMAAGEWILQLDADEYLREESRPELLEGIKKPDVLAYSPAVRNHFEEGRHEIFYPARIFRRIPGVRYSGKIHEQVTPALLAILKSDPRWRTGTLEKVVIEHLGYMQQSKENKNKKSRNISLLTRALAEDPGDLYRRFKLAQELGSETEIGYRHLSMALEGLLRHSDREIREMAFAHELLGNAALRLAGRNEPQKALRICAIAESLFRPHPVLSFVKALSNYLLHDIDNSLGGANEALAMAWPPGAFVCRPDWLREDIYLLISRILQEKGEYSRAIDTLRSATTESPASRRLALALVRSAITAGVPLLALEEGAKWMKSHGRDAECLLLCAEAAQMHGDRSCAARWRSLAAEIGTNSKPAFVN
ncbi:MAG: glycosyltransferase [Syntrophobacteraceae bacterium]